MKAHNNTKTAASDRSEWRTPQYLFRFAKSLTNGRLDYDTACNEKNALAPRAAASRDDGDALAVGWRGVCWCNPPYSETKVWVDYALSQPATTLLLIPSPNGESYYEDLITKAHEIAIIGRIAFIDSAGAERSGNNRGSSLFVINGYSKGTRSLVTRDAIKKAFE